MTSWHDELHCMALYPPALYPPQLWFADLRSQDRRPLSFSIATCYLRMRTTVVLFDQASEKWVRLVWCCLPVAIVVCGDDLNSSLSVESERRFLSATLFRQQLMYLIFTLNFLQASHATAGTNAGQQEGRGSPSEKSESSSLVGRQPTRRFVNDLVLWHHVPVENVLLFVARGVGFIWE